MKKQLLVFIVIMLVSLIMPITVSADMGPKESVSVEFSGMENKEYYITLLSKEESTGPFSFSKNPIDGNNPLIEKDKKEE